MKMKVIRASDKKTEVLTLVPPLAIAVGKNDWIKLSAADGVDHFFNDEGFYDGWGRNLGADYLPTHGQGEAESLAKVQEEIVRYEKSREVEERIPADGSQKKQSGYLLEIHLQTSNCEIKFFVDQNELLMRGIGYLVKRLDEELAILKAIAIDKEKDIMGMAAKDPTA
jgi:hypothetical protein